MALASAPTAITPMAPRLRPNCPSMRMTLTLPLATVALHLLLRSAGAMQGHTPSDCAAYASCEQCRSKGCGWCLGAGKCAADAVGHCKGGADHVGLASNTWLCPAAPQQQRQPAPIDECLLLAKLGGFERAITQASARDVSGGWLQLKPAADGGRWATQWCRVAAGAGGAELRCGDDPGTAAERAVALAACTSLGASSERSPIGGRAMALACGKSASHLVAGVSRPSQKCWMKTLLTVVAAQACERALSDAGITQYQESSAALVAAALWSRLGFRARSLPFWERTVSLQGPNAHLMGAAGWAHVDAGLFGLATAATGGEAVRGGGGSRWRLQKGTELLQKAAWSSLSAARGSRDAAQESAAALAVCEVVRLLAIDEQYEDAEALVRGALGRGGGGRGCWECVFLLVALQKHQGRPNDALTRRLLAEHRTALRSVDSEFAAPWMAGKARWSPAEVTLEQLPAHVARGEPLLLRSRNKTCALPFGWQLDVGQAGALANATEEIVTLELSPPHGRLGRGLFAQKLRMPLREALQLMAAKGGWLSYLNVGTAQPGEDVYGSPLSGIAEQIPPPDVIKARLVSANLWLGYADVTRGALHSDEDDNVLAVTRGTKSVLLISPQHVAAVAPIMPPAAVTKSGRLEGAREGAMPVSAYFALGGDAAAEAVPSQVEVELNAGDALFIPAGWWHRINTRAGEGGTHAAVNFWFSW